MISNRNRLINQLLKSVYKDKKDPTLIRVDIDNTIKILSMFGYNIPTFKFEKKLEELLNAKLKGATINPGLSSIVVNLMIDLAEKMHISEEAIASYITEHNTEQDVKELQSKIVNWRKEYYGSMDKSDKQALLNAIEGKLRPDVIEQIRKA